MTNNAELQIAEMAAINLEGLVLGKNIYPPAGIGLR
jgi:hypothetical protein